MAYRVENVLEFENAKIPFKNFSGRETKYNRAGDRNFTVIIPDEELALQLRTEGWNVRQLKSRDPQEPGDYALDVNVSYKGRPPRVVLIAHGRQTVLDEKSINVMDYADIANIDLVVTPYNWNVNGKSGVKAYLRSMYVTLAEDKFAAKYADMEYTDDVPLY